MFLPYSYAQVDLPLAKLLEYQGSSPRPADFDAYWDASLQELDAHDPQVKLERNHSVSYRNVECFDLTFTGIGGARVYAKYLRPARWEKPSPAILAFHGYSGSSGEWYGHLPYAAEGFCVAALDCRGQGGKSEDNLSVLGRTLNGHIIRGLGDPDPKKLYYRYQFLDTALLARIVMSFEEVDASRVGVRGGSQGGALAIACAALEPRIAMAAPIYPFLSDYRRVWESDLGGGAYQELKDFFRCFDPCHQREEEIFNRLGYIDIQNLAPRVKAKVRWAIGLMDTICPPSSQMAAYNKITAPKELIVYPDFAHEGLPGEADQAFNFLSQLRDC